jgi:hypothetical protein
MGCWCETCGITHMPIDAGDKCRVFFITQQDYGTEKQGGGFSYSNEVWYPRGLPLRGTYNDYGGLDDIEEDTNSKILIEGLKNDWVPYKAQHQWERDVNPADLDVYVVMEETERDRAKVYDGDSPTRAKRMQESLDKMKEGKYEPLDESPHPEDRDQRPFGLMFVHEDVYQAMINYDPIDAHHTDEGYLYRPRSKILEDDMREWYNKGLEACKDLSSLRNDKRFRSMMMDAAASHWNAFNSFRSDPPFCKGVSYYYDFLREKMQAGVPYEDPEVQTVAKGLIEFTKFTWAMGESRRAWMPQSGKGSQNNETEIHKILAGTVIAVSAARDKEIEQYRDEMYDGVDWKMKHNEEELAKRAAKASPPPKKTKGKKSK